MWQANCIGTSKCSVPESERLTAHCQLLGFPLEYSRSQSRLTVERPSLAGDRNSGGNKERQLALELPVHLELHHVAARLGEGQVDQRNHGQVHLEARVCGRADV